MSFTARTKYLTVLFGLCLLFVQSLALVHDIVHPFHAEFTDNSPELNQTNSLNELHVQSENSLAASQGMLNVIDGWACDLWQNITYSELPTGSDLSFTAPKCATPGLVIASTIQFLLVNYPSYWGQAPPQFLNY